MDKDMILAIINTLNTIEVKGYSNMDKIIGIINVLNNELTKIEGEANAK